MTLDSLLARVSLEGLRRSGDSAKALCPAHDDKRASLDLDDGRNGGVVLICRAGCSTEAVVQKLGLRMSDLMPERPRKRRPHSVAKRSSRKTAATYDYRDEKGVVLYQVLRYVPKDFRQRRPDGNGGWIWNLDGVGRVLYRLPELKANLEKPVFIVEGEKDVDRLASLDYIATTCPGGAGKWRSEFSEFLRGRQVVILPDADDPGARHGQEVSQSIHGIAESVRVVNMPDDKKDVSDWLDAGGTKEDLDRLVRETPEWAPPRVAAASDLLDELLNLIQRFVVMTEAQAVAWALWVVHTHVLDAADETAYLSITSPEKRCGKTRVLEVSELVVAEPWLTGRTSAAALVRKIDRQRPTLLLDESDAAFNGEKDYAEALRSVLNTGHRVNGRASLCVGQGTNIDVRDFSTFCAKAIAGIGKLPDTVADRAIPIRLQRKTAAEKTERFRKKKILLQATSLHAKLRAWAASNVVSLRACEPELPEELSDRAQDGAEPLAAIADLAGGEWPQLARGALVELMAGDKAEDESLGVRLLRDCRFVFENRPDTDRLASSDLCAAVVELEECPWRELNKGKPLTVRGLARLLNPYGIVSGTVRVGEKTPKGYYRASFQGAWERYLPSGGLPNATPPQPNAGGGSLNFSIRHMESPVADEGRQVVNTDRACGGVADKTPGTGKGSVSDGSAAAWEEIL